MVSVIESFTKRMMSLEPAIPPWKTLKWSAEAEQRIYKEWGDYYTHRVRLNLARHYYDKAVAMDPLDFRAFYKRSRCKRLTALARSAYKDAKKASDLAYEQCGLQNAQMNLEVCKGLYQSNLYEEALMELHNNSTAFRSRRNQSFKRFDTHIVVLEENFADSLGPSYGPFMFSNEKIIDDAIEKFRREHLVDMRPLWKIMRDQGKCDILSILEKEELILSPMERARRERAFAVFAQTLLKESWIDAVYLRNIIKNPNLLLEQCKTSTKQLSKIVSDENLTLKRFLKMLQVQTPMYFVYYNKCLNKYMCAKYHEDYLFRAQYQTRRNMHIALNVIKKLRQERKLQRLATYIENLMGDYTVIKTYRTMPWKFEFMNEVYNTLALAYIEQYTIPPNLKFDDKMVLRKLLNLPERKEFVEFIVNDRSTYNDPDAVDPVIEHARQMVIRYEKRMLFAKHAIEKAYLKHQIAFNYLTQNRYDECCSNARKAIEEARSCNNIVWDFLAHLLICKANIHTHKSQTAKEILETTLEVAYRMNYPKITAFVELCYSKLQDNLRVKQSPSMVSSIAVSNASMAFGNYFDNDS